MDLLGKPMLAYVIDAAKKAKIFGDDIYVSTENKTIEKIAINLEAKVPQLRPNYLAQDPYGVKDVLEDFLLRNDFTKKWTTVVILLPTSPLILSSDIIDAYKTFTREKSKTLLSVTETGHNSYRSIEIKGSFMSPLFPEKIKKRTQELEPTYRINGAVIIVDRIDFLKHKNFFGTNTSTFIMPQERSIDVDTPFDFKLAEIFLKQKEKQK